MDNKLNINEDEIEKLYYETLQQETLPARRENKLPIVTLINGGTIR